MELQKEKERQGCKMFIGGLTLHTTQQMLEEYYSQWGEVIDCVVMKDPHTSRPRGFGFITYTSPECVERCLAEGPHEIDDRIVETKRAVPREETRQEHEPSSKSKKVFLGGLSLETTEADIADAVRHFGEIDEVFLIIERETNKPRGFGFVTFVDSESANKLCIQRYVRIRDRDVEAKRAVSLDSMKRQPPSRPPPRRSEMPDRSHRSHGSSSRDHHYIPPPPYQQSSYHSQPQYGGQYSDYPPQPYRDEYYNNGGYRGAGRGGGGGGAPSYRPPYNSGSGGYGGVGGGPGAYGGYSYNGGPGGYHGGGGGGGYSGGGYSGYPRGGEMSAQSGRGGGGGGGGYRNQGGAASRSYHPYRRPYINNNWSARLYKWIMQLHYEGFTHVL